MVTEAKSFQSVTEQADRLLAQLDRPPEVDKITTSIDEDEFGETALFIKFHLAKGAGKSEKDIKKLTEFSGRVQVHLMGNGITYFPYVFLEEAA